MAALLKNATKTPTTEDYKTSSDFAKLYARLVAEEAQAMIEEDPDPFLRLMYLISAASECHG